MNTLQQEIVKRRTSSKTAIRNAQLLDCAQFYKKYEKFLEMDEVDNLLDFNDGDVNLIFHGTDESIAMLFHNGNFRDWAYC